MNENKVEAVYGLTAMQEGMLYNSLINKDAGTDLVQMRTVIKGKLDIDCLVESINRVIARHGTLRTVFMYQNLDEPKQVVIGERRCNVGFTDLETLQEGECESEINRYLEQDRKNRMNLSKSMLFRVHVFKCPNSIYNIIYTFHHIILDGWSVGIVMNEIYIMYDSMVTGNELRLPEPVNMGQYLKWLEHSGRKG